MILLNRFIIKETEEGTIVEFWVKEDLICFSHYTSTLTCKTGIKNIRYNAQVANIEDRTVDNWEKVKNPKFIISQNGDTLYSFFLVAKNGTRVTQSKGFAPKENCLNAIDSLKKNSIYAETIKEVPAL